MLVAINGVLNMENTLKKILKEKLNLNIDSLEVQKLFGHASYRTYYRVHLKDGKTYIVMQMPEGVSSVSEEITNYEGPKNELPFINIQRYLVSLKLPVPAVYAWDEASKLMLLEDLGDRHLESYLKEASPALQISFYKRAIDLLVEMQKKTTQAPSKDCIAFHRSFDEKLLNWEFDHFLEYGIEDRFKIKVAEEDKKVFEEFTRKISKEIASSTYGFVHRDFQSRNILLKDYQLYILDFQDALQGPPSYDLVSLTRDSYIELTPSAVEELLSYFIEARKKAKIAIDDEKSFRRLFYLTALQRKLKDTGRFQFINTVKGNPSFLVSVPSSLRYIKDTFVKLPELERLKKMIGKYVKELD